MLLKSESTSSSRERSLQSGLSYTGGQPSWYNHFITPTSGIPQTLRDISYLVKEGGKTTDIAIRSHCSQEKKIICNVRISDKKTLYV